MLKIDIQTLTEYNAYSRRRTIKTELSFNNCFSLLLNIFFIGLMPHVAFLQKGKINCNLLKYSSSAVMAAKEVSIANAVAEIKAVSVHNSVPDFMGTL